MTTIPVTIVLEISANLSGSDLINSAGITSANDANGLPVADEDDVIDGSDPNSDGEIENEIADDSDTTPGVLPNSDNPFDQDHVDFAQFFVCITGVDIEDVGLCDGEGLVLIPQLTEGVPPFNYSWAGPNSFSATTETLVINNITLDESGIYSVTVVDGNGCEASTTTEVEVFSLPALEIQAVPEVLCIYDEPIELVATPAGGIIFRSWYRRWNTL